MCDGHLTTLIMISIEALIQIQKKKAKRRRIKYILKHMTWYASSLPFNKNSNNRSSLTSTWYQFLVEIVTRNKKKIYHFTSHTHTRFVVVNSNDFLSETKKKRTPLVTIHKSYEFEFNGQSYKFEPNVKSIFFFFS